MHECWVYSNRYPSGHDRARGEQPIFGKVRHTVEASLRRKIDIDECVRGIEEDVIK
jgi:hypothetical protein